MLHWLDITDASNCHWVMDFHGNAPHIPLMGEKMSLHGVCVFWGYFSYKKGWVLFTLVRFEFDYHSKLWCALGNATRTSMKWLTFTLCVNLLHLSCSLDKVWQLVKLLDILRYFSRTYNFIINDFCKGHCDLSTCKDSVCLLSNLVKHVFIAYGPLGSFFSFVILLYILLSCQLQTSRMNLQILTQDFMCHGLYFWMRTQVSCGKPGSESYKLRVKSRKASRDTGPEA